MNKRPSANQNQIKKGGIAEEIEKLKQRREERKNKGGQNDDGGKNTNSKSCDAEYENLMRKKKIQFNQEPENVKIISQ